MPLKLSAILLWVGAPALYGETGLPRGFSYPGNIPKPVDYTLVLGGTRFDPLIEAPQLPESWRNATLDGPDFRLIQFHGPTRPEWLAALDGQGLTVVRYIHPFTYVVWGTADSLERAAAEAQVRWRGPFDPGFRVLPRLRNLDGAKVGIFIIFFRAVEPEPTIAGLRALGADSVMTRNISEEFQIFSLGLPGNRIRDAALLPGVYSIQAIPTGGGNRGEMSNQVCALNLDGSQQAQTGYLSWLADLSLSGAGVVIANVDTGIHDSHPDLADRMIACAGVSCGGAAESGHGTHTAGIMAADGSSAALDGFGFLRGLGMAPGANLVEQVYTGIFNQPGGMLLLMTESSRNGALLSGNSWGPADTPQGYDNQTMQVDIGVRDADPDTAGHQPFTFVVSIMNGFGGTQSQGTPEEAKNLLSVGSTNMQAPDGSQFPTIGNLSVNTAHGPALDGRNLPLLVAPGRWVDSCQLGGGHVLRFGTSMASPHVSGTVALFVERYRGLAVNRGAADPSPALVKAALLPVARDLTGNLDADGNPLVSRFDAKQGWGRLDAAAVLDPPAETLYFDNPVILEQTGDGWAHGLKVDDPFQPVRIMLAWTDAPGHGLGGATPAWNNDLDLIVTYQENTYLGNVFGSGGWSVPGGTADLMHNTEAVFLGPVADGRFTVRVLGSNLTSDGIPDGGTLTDQDFALVCYNCDRDCTSSEDFMDRLPGWPLAESLASMIVCINTFMAP